MVEKRELKHWHIGKKTRGLILALVRQRSRSISVEPVIETMVKSGYFANTGFELHRSEARSFAMNNQHHLSDLDYLLQNKDCHSRRRGSSGRVHCQMRTLR